MIKNSPNTNYLLLLDGYLIIIPSQLENVDMKTNSSFTVFHLLINMVIRDSALTYVHVSVGQVQAA